MMLVREIADRVFSWFNTRPRADVPMYVDEGTLARVTRGDKPLAPVLIAVVKP